MSPIFQPAPTEMFAGGVARLPSPWAHSAHRPAYFAFLVCFAIVCVSSLLHAPFTETWRWLERLFWLLAAATSLIGLARRLPEQNVLVSSFFVIATAAAAAAIAVRTGVPFG